MSFSKDIKNFIEKTENKATVLLKEVSKETATRIAERTGVDTGNLLGNYCLGLNNQGTVPGFDPGPTAWIGKEKDESIAAANKERALNFFENHLNIVLSNINLKDKFYMHSEEEYAPNVEYIGWKKTGPYRMFGKTIVEFIHIVTEKARELTHV